MITPLSTEDSQPSASAYIIDYRNDTIWLEIRSENRGAGTMRLGELRLRGSLKTGKLMCSMSTEEMTRYGSP